VSDMRPLIRAAGRDFPGAVPHIRLTPLIVRGWFGAADYIRLLVLPDFFYISITHAILHLGAKIRRRDYPGNLTQQKRR
jgi:hypothetical protein